MWSLGLVSIETQSQIRVQKDEWRVQKGYVRHERRLETDRITYADERKANDSKKRGKDDSNILWLDSNHLDSLSPCTYDLPIQHFLWNKMAFGGLLAMKTNLKFLQSGIE